MDARLSFCGARSGGRGANDVVGATVGMNAAAGAATSKLRTLYRQAIVVGQAASGTESSKLEQGPGASIQRTILRDSRTLRLLSRALLGAREIGVGPRTRRAGSLVGATRAEQGRP